MIKLIALLTRRPELTHEEFVERWQRGHAPLALQVAGIRKYAISPVRKAISRADIPDHDIEVDGVAELWFDDVLAMEASLHAEEGTILTSDGAKFIGRIRMFVCDEIAII